MDEEIAGCFCFAAVVVFVWWMWPDLAFSVRLMAPVASGVAVWWLMAGACMPAACLLFFAAVFLAVLSGARYMNGFGTVEGG